MPGEPTLLVYLFDYLDKDSQVWMRSPVPATMEAISANGWRAVPRTGRLMARSQIATNGVAYRTAKHE